MQYPYLAALLGQLTVMTRMHYIPRLTFPFKGSQSEISKMKAELEAFRDQIQYKRSDLPELYSKIGAYKDSVIAAQKTLELSSHRAKYLELANTKFFVPAANLVQAALDITTRYKIDSADTYKAVVLEDKKRLSEQIFDELLAHVFLKKPAAFHQWFHKVMQELPQIKKGLPNLPLRLSQSVTVDVSSWSEKDLIFAPAEFDFKPDSNSIIFVSSLLKALQILGSLEGSLNVLEQRVSTELFEMVEQEMKDAEDRARSTAGSGSLRDKFVLIRSSGAEAEEFFGFCPVLRELTSCVIAKLITVANTFKFITVAVENMAEEGHNPFDGVQTPLRVAAQAVNREMRSFAISFIYGAHLPSATFLNPVADIAEILKNSKTKSTANTSALFEFSMQVDSATLAEIKAMGIQMKEREKVLARKMAIAMNADPYISAKKDVGHMPITKPNVQYVALLFSPIKFFTELIEGLVANPSLDLQSPLPLIEGIIEKEYVPLVETHSIHELSVAFKGIDGATWVNISNDPIKQECIAGRASSSVLSCYLTFVRLFSELCRLIYFLPDYQAVFERILESLMEQLLDKSEIKLRDLILAKSSGEDDLSSTVLCLSVQLAKNQDIRDILSQNTLLRGVADSGLNRLLAEKETLLMERLKGDRSIGRSELIQNPKTVRNLALLQRSFEQLRGLMMCGSYQQSHFVQGRGQIKLVADDKQELFLHVYDEGDKEVFKLGSSFDAKLLIFSELLEKLALTCLYTLHCEIRTHCFFYLDLAAREGNYNLDIPYQEPDPYILSLNADILDLSNSLSDWFPLSKFMFLFDGLTVVIDSVLVNNFRYIKGLNGLGCRKLGTNVIAMIQLLSQILPPSEVALPRATEYFRLASLPANALMTEINTAASRPIRFSYLQYKALLDVAFNDALQTDMTETTRQLYMNQLTSLKYLLEESKNDVAAAKRREEEETEGNV
jgi:exocyst complex component 4